MKALTIYWLTKIFVRLYCTLFVTLRVQGLENVPRSTGAIIVANHRSHLDGFLLYSLMNRMSYAFIKSDFFKKPLLRWYLSGGGGIPLRKGDVRLSAMRQAKRVLSDGHILLLFPEGRINEGIGLLPFENTFLRLALKHHVPVVPAVIVGTQNVLPEGQWFPKPCQIVIVFKQPFCIESRPGTRTAIDSQVERLRHLIEETIENVEVTDPGSLDAERLRA
jgi:1-acyl-sn-glycerol-3-phosphate acyltransferase